MCLFHASIYQVSVGGQTSKISLVRCLSLCPLLRFIILYKIDTGGFAYCTIASKIKPLD